MTVKCSHSRTALLGLSEKWAQKRGCNCVGVDSVMFALLDHGAVSFAGHRILVALLGEHKQVFLVQLGNLSKESGGCNHVNPVEKLPKTARLKRAMDLSTLESVNNNHLYVGTEHLLLAILTDQNDPVTQLLGRFGVTKRDASKYLGTMLRGEN